MREFTKQGRLEEKSKILKESAQRNAVFSASNHSVYVIVSIIMMASVDGEWWLNKDGSPREDPIFAFFDAVVSTEIGLVLALLAVLTMISGALSGLLAASRFLFAMAKDSLLPNSLSETNNKFETPHWSIIITAVTMAIYLDFTCERCSKIGIRFPNNGNCSTECQCYCNSKVTKRSRMV